MSTSTEPVGIPDEIIAAARLVSEWMDRHGHRDWEVGGICDRMFAQPPSEPTWVRQALCSGGTMTVFQVLSGKSIFKARMDWSGEQPIVGIISTTPIGAIRELEAALIEDVAQEMRDKGQV